MEYWNKIVGPITTQVDEFKRRYSLVFSSPDPKIDTLLKFLQARKGKMMRPILVLLVARYSNSFPDRIYSLASSVELLHQGSLIHDDVVDESDLRRGKQSVNSAFDNKLAVLLGDFIVSQSLQQIASTGSVDCIGAISKLIGTLSEGEIIQIEALDSDTLSENVYFDIISRKTAYLFSMCARLSAILSGASAADADAFGEFGQKAGLCFQIMDDILDYHDRSETGKPSGNDLKEGKFTLPAIHVLNSSSVDWSNEIKSIRSLEAGPDIIRKVTEYTLSNGGIEYAVSRMMELKRQAMSVLPASMTQELRCSFQSYLDLITDRLS